MRDFVAFILFMASFFALVAAPALGLGYAFVAWQCSAYESTTGKATKVSAGTCYIQQDGQWMHWDEYKLRFATKGAQ